MKNFKKLSVAIVALAMCALLSVSVWAANSSGVSYTADFDDAKLCITGVEQTATLTININKEVEMDSVTAQVKSDLEISDITFEAFTDVSWNKETGMIIAWNPLDAANVSTDVLAVLTLKVPADVKAGTYKVTFDIQEISKDYGTPWEDGEILEATLTVAEHDFTNGDCECGAKKPVTDISVIYKGADLETAYTVEGSVVTVTYSLACKVGYWNETEGKYVALTATKVSDNTYSFTAPEGVAEVLLVVKGDVSSDGKVNNTDVTQAKAIYLGRKVPTNEATFAGDTTGDGVIKNPDVTQIKAHYLGRKDIAW